MHHIQTNRNYSVFIILNLLLSFITFNLMRLVLAKNAFNISTADIFDDSNAPQFNNKNLRIGEETNRTLLGGGCGSCPCLCVCKGWGACCSDIAFNDNNCLTCGGFDGYCVQCQGDKTLINNICTENPNCISTKSAQCVKCKPGTTLRANGACEPDKNCALKTKTTGGCEDGFRGTCHKGGCFDCKDGFAMDESWGCQPITSAPTYESRPTSKPIQWPTMSLNKWPTSSPVTAPTRKPILKGL